MAFLYEPKTKKRENIQKKKRKNYVIPKALAEMT